MQSNQRHKPEAAFDDCAGVGPVGLGSGFEPGLLDSSSAKMVSRRASTPATACDRKLPHLDDLFPCAAMALRIAGNQMAWPSSCGRACNERRGSLEWPAGLIRFAFGRALGEVLSRVGAWGAGQSNYEESGVVTQRVATQGKTGQLPRRVFLQIAVHCSMAPGC